VGVHPVAAAGFGAAADVYERARPGYPDAAVTFLADRLDLRRGRTVLDLAAGTGKLTRALVSTGARVVAVEPVDAMRAQLERVVPDATSMAGTAEAIPFADASVDAVTVAQGFHWFDALPALAEIHRVLRPGGSLALVWNSRDLDDELQRRLEELLAPLRGEVESQALRAWRPVVEQSTLFGAPEQAQFPYVQQFRASDLKERVASTSFVAAMSEVDRTALLARVGALVHGRTEPFPFPYRTEVWVLPRVGSSIE
jgi:ubiquinone/menaquinone biosynthesis C-methylase UbiE